MGRCRARRADADAKTSLYTIGVDAALKKLWEQHRYTTSKPPYAADLLDDDLAGDWGNGHFGNGNGNGSRRRRAGRADRDVVVAFHKPSPYSVDDEQPLPAPVQPPPDQVIPDPAAPDPPSEVPPDPQPDLASGPDDPFPHEDVNDIWNVAGILLGEDEARGSLILDNRYVLKDQLPGVEPGGGGTVWQARDLLDPARKRLVVKTVQLGGVHLGQLKALVREQRVAGARSEHIGEILDHGQDRGFMGPTMPREDTTS